MNDLIPYSDMEKMATVMGHTGMFGKNGEQLLALMLIAQAEGIHPARAAQEYDVIQGRPALKAQAALARFQESGGHIKWITRTEEEAKAEFSHPKGDTIEVKWDMAKARKRGLADKDNWKKMPGTMLMWRVASEGIRICYPACLNRLYIEYEVEDMEYARPIITEDIMEMQDVRDSNGQFSPPSDPGEPAKRGDGIASEMLELKKELAGIIATEYEGQRIFTKADADDMNAAWHPGGRDLISSENDRNLLRDVVEAWTQKRDAILAAHKELDGAQIPDDGPGLF